jgi:hypothetical protein
MLAAILLLPALAAWLIHPEGMQAVRAAPVTPAGAG